MPKPISPLRPSEVQVSESLLSGNFQSLVWTQWLTALNDNIFRWVAIGIGKDFFEPRHQSYVLMAGTAIFLLPWILFAAPAGYLADRFRKRNVIVACKILEILVMVFGAYAIYVENFALLLVAVGLMGTQSALFAPAKIGTIPELMGSDKIAKANGFMNLASLSATIIGMAVAAVICDACGFKGTEANLWLPSAVLVGTAIAGTLTSLPLRAFPAQNPGLGFSFNLFSDLWRDQKRLFNNGTLFRVALGIVIFWSIASLGQLNVDQFAEESGKLIESHRTPLLVSLVLGVGFGSVLAGLMSGGRIELGMVPWGALGISVFCFLLFLAPPEFIDSTVHSSFVVNYKLVIACTLLVFLGVSAGFFNIPLTAYIQHKSPAESRGAILSALNCLTFAGMMLTALLFFAMRLPVHQGSFADVPKQYRSVSLELEQREKVEEWLIRFQRQDENPETFVKQIGDVRLRAIVVARIVWEELQKEGNVDPDAGLSDRYRRIYDQELVEDVTDENVRAVIAAQTACIELQRDRNMESAQQFREFYQRFENHSCQRAAKAVYVQSSQLPLLSSRQVFLVMSLMAIPLFLYATYRLSHAMVRFFLWRVMRVVYRIRVVGEDNIPANGGAVLVCNHISWIDGILMLLMTTRTTRMLAWAGNFKSPIRKLLADFSRTILMTTGPKSIQSALAQARKALGRGELLGIFPEGGLSRTSAVQSFKPGLMRVLDKTPVPILPVYIDEMWGSNLTFANSGSIFRFPKKIRRQITINIGKPFQNPEEIHFVRQHVQQLGAAAVNTRQSPFQSPAQKFVRCSKKRKRKLKLACSTGQTATGGMLLMRCLILRRLLVRHLLAPRHEESHVGVLIPPSFGGVAVNLSLGLDRRVAVNLNYTVSSSVLNECIRQAGLKKILTSKKVWEKLDYDLDAEIVFVEELRDQVSLRDKIAGFLGSYLLPAALLDRWLGLHQTHPDDLLTIIFTSGSTGVPKGVKLTQKNVASNVDAIDQVINLNSEDVIVGVLPFFHSFGFTVTLYGAMGLDLAGIYHFNPLDAKQIGKLTKKYGGTVLLGTPTFLRTYVRRIEKDEFETLDTVVAGAEKLPKDLCDAFERKFGVRPVEGYGTTELSPLASVNIPPSRSRGNFQVDSKEGTVGRPIPNVAAKVTDLDDDELELGVGQAGMLWITGPNVMAGYLNQPAATADVIKDGWYKTGDVALIDNDGFITITGRISRFSKIGGEMVPHVKIEELLNSIVGEDLDEDGEIDELKMAVSSIPDAKKGERLIVLHTPIRRDISELCNRLSEEGLPNIYIPSVESFVEIEELPILGTGKLDLKLLKEMAAEKFAAKKTKT